MKKKTFRFIYIPLFIFLLFSAHSNLIARNAGSETSKAYEKLYEELDVIEDQLKSSFEIQLVERKVKLLLDIEEEQQALDFLTTLISSNSEEKLKWVFLRGKTLLNLGYKLSAMDDLNHALQKGFKKSELFRILGSLKKKEKKFSEALIFFRDATDLDSEDDYSWYERAQTEFLLNKFDEAEDSIQQAIEIKPDELRYKKLVAQIYYLSGNKIQAQRVLEQIIDDFPSDQWAYRELINFYLKEGSADLAIELIAQTIKVFPDEAEFYFQKGIAYNSIGKLQLSIDSFKEGLAISPESWVHTQMARIFGKIKNMPEAIYHLNQARGLGTSNLIVYHILTQFYFEQGRTYLAEEIILEGLDLDQSDPTLLAIYGTILEKRGQLNEAEYAFRKILKQRPDKESILSKLANVLRKKKLHEESDALFRKSIQLNQFSYWTRSLFVESLMEQGKWREAKIQVQEMLRLNFNDFRVYTQKALIERQLGNLVQAIADINKAIILNSKSIGLKELEAKILEDMGKLDLAESSLKEALLISPDNIAILFQLAFLQNAQGKVKEALNNIQKFISLSEPNLASMELHESLANKGDWHQLDQKTSLALKLILTKKYDQSSKILESRDDLNSYLVSYLRRSLTSQVETKFEYKSMDEYRTLVASKSLTAWQLLYLAFQLTDLKETQLAKEALEQANLLEPDNPWIQVRLAKTYENLEQHEKASSLYQKYLLHLPNNHWANLRLALNYDLNKQPLRAEKIYQKLLLMNPNDQVALNNLAWLYLTSSNEEMKNVDKALELSLQAVRVYQSAANLDTLAEAYFQKADYEKALETIEKALDQDQDNLDHFKKQKKKFERAIQESLIKN